MARQPSMAQPQANRNFQWQSALCAPIPSQRSRRAVNVRISCNMPANVSPWPLARLAKMNMTIFDSVDVDWSSPSLHLCSQISAPRYTFASAPWIDLSTCEKWNWTLLVQRREKHRRWHYSLIDDRDNLLDRHHWQRFIRLRMKAHDTTRSFGLFQLKQWVCVLLWRRNVFEQSRKIIGEHEGWLVFGIDLDEMIVISYELFNVEQCVC